MTSTTIFDVMDLGDSGGTLTITITDEGVIADAIVDGEVVASWGATAQELVESYCH